MRGSGSARTLGPATKRPIRTLCSHKCGLRRLCCLTAKTGVSLIPPISLISTQAWKRVRTHFRMHAPDSTCWYALSTILGSIVHGLGYVHRSLGRTFHALTWWHWDALGAKNWASGEQGELCVQMYGQMFVFFVWWCRKVGVEQTPYEKHRKNCRNIEHEIFGLLDADPTLIPGKIKSDLASKESNVCVCVTVCSPSNWLGHCV